MIDQPEIVKTDTHKILQQKEDSSKIDFSQIHNLSKNIFQPARKTDSSSKNRISQQSDRNRKSNEVMKNIRLYNKANDGFPGERKTSQDSRASFEKNLGTPKPLPTTDRNFTDRLESEINQTTDRFGRAEES